ncbi:hypothetical protein ACVWW4_004245 [Bradyrhizobium sp. LB7.1]
MTRMAATGHWLAASRTAACSASGTVATHTSATPSGSRCEGARQRQHALPAGCAQILIDHDAHLSPLRMQPHRQRAERPKELGGLPGRRLGQCQRGEARLDPRQALGQLHPGQWRTDAEADAMAEAQHDLPVGRHARSGAVEPRGIQGDAVGVKAFVEEVLRRAIRPSCSAPLCVSPSATSNWAAW